MRPFVAGAVTGLSGAATSVAAASLLRLDSNPVLDVAAVVRDLTPGPVAELLIGVVQHLDKPLLVAGTALGLIALTGWAGVRAAHRPWQGYVVLAVLGAVGLAGVLHQKHPTPASFLPLIVGLATWLVLLPWLVGAAVRAETEVTGRRAFLTRTAGTFAASLVVTGLAGWWGQARSKAEEARRLLRLPVRTGAVPVGANLRVDGVEPWRTPNEDFYLINVELSIPTITPDDWSLRIHGMVDQPLVITYDQLARRQLTQEWITLCCVSNEVGGDLISNAFWSGVLVRDLLAEAGVKDGADAVKTTSQDGWTCGTPLSALTDVNRNAMLALAMNGKPLPLEHGFPVRMVVPGLYGYVSATKWLVDLEVTRFSDFSAYWTQNGWSPLGPVKTESRIDVPRSGQQVEAGKRRVGGSAWSQHTGIAKVEYQLDGKAWQSADLGTVPGNDTWVQWAGEVDLSGGDHVLVVRATDQSGYTQTAARADVVPDGATGWHTVHFSAR
ncbi:oxidoreductase [Nocardioides mangrovicus]|uniref:Oxidoreductase n=1 Tax=Nocardioides mangrovicus TaxID=2478913 RepID=A0A3L8P003_9ACTN|nr:oxidoreductase [Nocardioides mangrovicus]